MSITSTGIASGLDIESLVTQLVASEGAVESNRLTRSEAKFQAKLSAYGTLKGALSTFQSAIATAGNPESFQGKTATSSAEDSVKMTAGNDALVGEYDVNVSQLATKHSLYGGAYASESTVVGTGTLNFTLGTTTYDSSGDTYSFSQKAASTPVSITIDSSNNTLLGVRDAINAADAGVSASIVNDGSYYRLVMTAKDTGTENSLQVNVTDSDGSLTDGSGLSELNFNETTRQSTQLAAAQNAAFTINGLAVSSASNTVTTALSDVALTLGAVTSSSVKLTVDNDLNTASNAVNNFVAGYNNLTGLINNLTAYSAVSQSGSLLTGDATTRTLQSGLRNILNQVVTEATGGHQTLAALGITTKVADGTLEVDSTKLNTALTSDQIGVGQVFARLGASDTNTLNFLSSTSSTTAGTYAVVFDGSSGTINGVAASVDGNVLTGAIGSSVEGLKVEVVGGATGNVGSISFADGLSSRLDSLIDGLLADDGLLDARSDGLAVSIDDIKEQRLDLDARLLKIEARYRSQFLGMETLLSSLQSTSNYLSVAMQQFPEPLSFKK